jgi:hypothetical protein
MKNNPRAYLGHFNSDENMKRGHNQGAPPSSVTDPYVNPISATGLSSLADTSAASLAGGGTGRGAPRLKIPRSATGTPGVMSELGLKGRSNIRALGSKGSMRMGLMPKGIKPISKMKSKY